MKTAVFIGHNECYGLSVEQLNEVIIQCIDSGVTRFLSDGQGAFDRICGRAVFELKKQYPHVSNVLVIPYLSFNVFNKTLFDEIIPFDDFEKYHYRWAIPQRNKFMVYKSDVAICYVAHSWGNAAKTFELAKKRGLDIFNLATYIQ